MGSLENIHATINSIGQESRINISKIDNYKFKVVIDGELMDSFEKLGEIQNKILESCNGDYDLKTVYGDGQDATFILKKL